MYIGLLLVSPVINLALQQLKTRKELLTAAGIAFCVTALPSVTGRNLVPDYWEALYPFTYYILGAVIRRLQPEVKLWKGLALTAGLLAALSTVSLLATDDVFTAGYSQGYGGFWVTLITAMIFVSFYKLRLKPRTAKVAAWMAGGCFEGFLLSRLFDVWVYSAMPPVWRRPNRYWLLFLVVTVPIFICSILLGKMTHWASERLLDRIIPKKKEKTGKC
jgi:surface polysaccharide O-acyltransferase-like enzyme